MSQWEDEAIPFLAQELLGYTQPPINLDGTTYLVIPSESGPEPAVPAHHPVTPGPVPEPVLGSSQNRSAEILNEQGSVSSARSDRVRGTNGRWIAAITAVAALAAVAFLAGSQLGGGSGDDNAGSREVDTSANGFAVSAESTATPVPAPTEPSQEVDATEAMPTPAPTVIAEPAPAPTAEPTPQPTATPAATATAEPTPIPSPTATPEPNAVSGFDLNIVNYSMDDEIIERPKPVSLGGIEFEQSVTWGVNGRDTFHRSDWFLVEFPAARKFQCAQMTLGLATQTDPEFTATFIVLLDGEEYEQRVMNKFDLWRVDLTGLTDTGFVEVRWQFPNTDEEGYGVIADPIFFRSC